MAKEIAIHYGTHVGTTYQPSWIEDKALELSTKVVMGWARMDLAVQNLPNTIKNTHHIIRQEICTKIYERTLNSLETSNRFWQGAYIYERSTSYDDFKYKFFKVGNLGEEHSPLGEKFSSLTDWQTAKRGAINMYRSQKALGRAHFDIDLYDLTSRIYAKEKEHCPEMKHNLHNFIKAFR